MAAAPSVGENPEVLADQPTSMVTDEDPATNGAPVRWYRGKAAVAMDYLAETSVFVH